MTARPDAPSRHAAAAAGVTAAGVALGSGELAAAVIGAEPSPVLAVGGRFVDRFAASLKEVAVAVFGTNDKAALVVGTVVVTLALGAITGVLARRRALVAISAFAGFAGFGAWSQTSDPRVGAGQAVLVAVVSASTGLATLAVLWRLAGRAVLPVGALGGVHEPVVPAAASTSRRGFLSAAGAAGASAVGLAVVARSLTTSDVVAAVRSVGLPEPGRHRRVPDDASFRTAGASPYVVSTADFYRIDTALRAPRVDADGWRLRIGGMVDRPYSIDYEELLALPSVEEPVTLQCVSNEVGGDLVGNAVWQGVALTTLLERAGVQPGAEQVYSTSVDAWTAGFPIGIVDDGRPALVAYAMNGRPLPVEHGFPARLVVSGLYGYVSATKWLQAIELTTWDGADGYWIPRGWAKQGPVKLTSRVDVPRAGAQLPAGPTSVAGVAWRPGVGVAAVEISIDDGPWRECELGSVASEHTWVQWRYRWDATPGRHRVRVRAIDRSGEVQTETVSAPAPDGATGLHEVVFTVAA